MTKFKFTYKRGSDNKCIASYGNYTAEANPNAPAQLIIKDPKRVNDVFVVKDALGNDVPLSARWIAGFMDGEGTFTFFFNRMGNLTYGFQFQSAFILVQGESDYLLLTAIANFFGCGTVNVNRRDTTSVRYQIRIVNPETLVNVIIPFFTHATLLTKKGFEFLAWAEATQFLKENQKNFKANPSLAKTFVQMAKNMRYQGAETDKANSFINTCDEAISNIETFLK